MPPLGELWAWDCLTQGPKFGGKIIVWGQQEYRWQQTPTQVVSSAPTGMHAWGGRGPGVVITGHIGHPNGSDLGKEQGVFFFFYSAPPPGTHFFTRRRFREFFVVLF